MFARISKRIVLAIALLLGLVFCRPAFSQVTGWTSDTGNEAVTGPEGLTNVKQIASGQNVSFELLNNGSIRAYGFPSNNDGAVPSGNDFTQVSCLDTSVLALKDNGTVVAWGWDFYGQAEVPAGLSNVIAVSAGDLFSMALKDDGTVVAWGDNSVGETTIPTGLAHVVAVSAGDEHALALHSDGTVVAWGDDSAGETVVPNGLANVVAIAAGAGCSFALLANGTVVGWGDNTYGEQNIPVGLSGVIAISTSKEGAVVALKSDGTVVAWGEDDDGETDVPPNLGGVTAIAAGWGQTMVIVGSQSAVAWRDNTFDESTVPYSEPVKAIATGYDTSLALTTNGIPISWGSAGTLVPTDLEGVQSIACGENFALALLDDGTVVGWGDDTAGQVNIPNGLLNVKAIVCGTDFSIALLANGTLVGWGNPSSLGLVGISGITNVKSIAAGNEFGMALQDNGTLVAWGDDTYGQTTLPNGLAKVASVSCGFEQTVALLSNGTVTAWGDNLAGESSVPTGLSGVTQAQGGFFFSSALLSNGTVQIWGSNGNVPPTGFTGCTAIAATGWGVLAIAPPAVTNIYLDNPSIAPGTVSNVTVTVSPAAPAGGESVTISGTGPLALPLAIVIPPGAVSQSFQLQTNSVTNQSTQTITATLNGASETTTLTISPLTVSNVQFSAASVYEGNNETCTVTLSGNVPSSGASATISGTGPANLPSTLSFAAGTSSASFIILAPSVGATTAQSVTATLGQSAVTQSFNVEPSVIQSITAYPATIVGGATTGFTVTLYDTAGLSGDVVSISGTGPLSLPATVLVPAGQSSVNFTATSSAVSTSTQETVTASFNAGSVGAVVTITPPAVSRMTISPNAILGGDSTEATVELSGKAATGGQKVSLLASTSAVTVPASITIPAGSSTYSFLLKTKAVNSNTPTTVTAKIGSASQAGTVTVLPTSLSELVVQPTVQGGTSEEVGVFLASSAGSSGVTVMLSSNNAALVTPTSVKVPAGSSSYWYVQKTSGVNTSTPVKVTAKIGSSSVSASTTLTPAALNSVSLSRTTVSAGTNSLGTVSLSGPAGSSGVVVNLSSGNSPVASVPASVTVTSGAATASFAVTTSGVNASTQVTLTATLNTTSKIAGITVNPASLDLVTTPTSVTGGSGANVTVKLTGPAGPAGAVVSLSSSSSSCAVPATVNIPAGQSQVEFTAPTKAVTSNTSATITGTYNGSIAEATLTVKS